MKSSVLGSFLWLFCLSAAADTPVVTEVVAINSPNGWRFDVTLEHADTGWDHYADGWSVYLADGTKLGTRLLAHPNDLGAH